MGLEKEIGLVIEEADHTLNDAYYFENGILYVRGFEEARYIHDILGDRFGVISIEFPSGTTDSDLFSLVFCTECSST